VRSYKVASGFTPVLSREREDERRVMFNVNHLGTRKVVPHRGTTLRVKSSAPWRVAKRLEVPAM